MSDAVYLIISHGLYFRPDCKGYTGIKKEAGRYTKEIAEKYTEAKYIHQDDAMEFMPATYHDLICAHHTAEIEKRDRAIEVLMAKLSAVRVKDITEEKSVFATLNEAQAILGEPFAATPEKGQVDVDDLAQFIRKVNGSSQMGAGVLAEHIVEYLHAQNMLKNPRKVNTSF